MLKSKISLLLLLLPVSAYPQDDINILSSDQNSIVIEYTTDYIDTSLVKIDDHTYYNVNIAYGSLLNPEEWGMPLIPERLFSLGVPSEYGNTIAVIRAEYSELEGMISPIPNMVPDGNFNVYKYSLTDDYYNYKDNPELVIFGEFGITRGVNNQTIRILPVKFDVNQRKIRLYKKIVFRITYSNGGTISKQGYDELLHSALINYDVARYWQNERKGLHKVIADSKLAVGNWIKFETEEEGIYKIDYNFLSSAGIDPSGLDPRTIKIYNNGGKALSENVNDARPVDLVENAISIVGEQDGSFDESDYILFYGRGINFWDYDSTQAEIVRFHHPYSDKNYFWLTYGGNNGKRIENKEGLTSQAVFVQTGTAAFADLEEDKINLGKTGRKYFGDDFSQAVLTRTYIISLNGRISTEPIYYNFQFVNASSENNTLRLSENNTTIFNQILSGYGNSSYIVGVLHENNAVFTGDLPDDRSVLKFNFIPSSVSSVGYLDYFEIRYRKDLRVFNDKLLFFSEDTSAVVEYYLHDFTSTNIQVYDISDYSNIKLIINPVLQSGGDYRFRVEETGGNISKYFAVGNNNYLSPSNPVSMSNSNIRGIQDGAKYIIITSDEFMAPANRLKNYRENDAVVPISTIIVDIDDIINEFAAGITDPTAVRDFIKYAYDNWVIQPEYLLLFGKGTYDAKNISGFNDNFIPTWQTTESLRLLGSYTSDDYFVDVHGVDSKMDLAPGRLTVSSESEADNYVTKLIDYELRSNKGPWKNLITLVADDGLTFDGDDRWAHTRPTEYIANNILPESFDLNKIYLADYPPVITGSGRRKPAVNEKIINSINEGTLLINYIGHGNPEVWAHEMVFEKSVSIPQLNNSRYFFFVAATCDFGYYDIPNFESAAEELIFLPNAGAIGGLNSARLVFSLQNNSLNYTFLTYLLNTPRDTLNLVQTIGASYFSTRQDRNTTNDKKYHLFADPLLRLQIPRYNGNIDSINGQPLITDVQVKALSNTSISGVILTVNGEVWEDYNGQGILTVFDSERTKLLEEIGNEPMVIPGGILFKGSISVVNGRFNTRFVVPKDISYENKNGKALFYFFNENSDGISFTKQIIVGGTDSTAVNDDEGPEIEIFFDDATIHNAYLVGPEPNLIVKLSDETGLNTTGTGIGHKMEGILNENDSAPIDFTGYFKGELDSGGKAGEINYNFTLLEEGDYNLKVKAWDVFNNFSSEETNFTVVSDDQLVIRDVYNYPNPFAGNTTFTFQHNLTQPLNVNIKVYTIAGRMIREIEQDNIDQKFVKISWDGRDEDGDLIANGTYLYKVVVKTLDGEFHQSVLGKMAAIR